MRVKLKKGFNINLVGVAEKKVVDNVKVNTYSFKPTDFQGIKRPKIIVNEGDTVKAGTPIFYDKTNESVMFTAPVSGEVVKVHRGEKRKPLEIRILADAEVSYEEFNAYNESSIIQLEKDLAREQLIKSGVWVNILERPFGITPNPEDTPRDIFISAFDTHPLAPDYEFVFQGQEKYLQAGINILKKFTSGKVHLSIPANSSSLFKNLTGVEFHEVSGPHPAGNVGVQIHHIEPISRGEKVWTTTPYGLEQIGRLFLEGKYDATKIIALAGSEVKNAQYYKVISGACVEPFIKDNLKSEHVRLISGNVLTGEKIEKDIGLGFYDNMFTVIPEGDYHELFGWVLPSTKKRSFHRTLGLISIPGKKYKLDTNLHGEKRAFVMTGVYERVVPMDILPVYLIKSILANDFEAMEALGIYEVIEEDLALCEFIDVSKTDFQAILREGIEALQEA